MTKDKKLESVEDKIVDEYVKEHRKNKKLATALLVFLGTLGIHRFYYGKFYTGFIISAITIAGALLKFLRPLIILSLAWVFIDFFIMRIKWFDEEEERLERNAIRKYRINFKSLR